MLTLKYIFDTFILHKKLVAFINKKQPGLYSPLAVLN